MKRVEMLLGVLLLTLCCTGVARAASEVGLVYTYQVGNDNYLTMGTGGAYLPGGQALYQMNVDGSNQHSILSGSADEFETPSWSPDGSQVTWTNAQTGMVEIAPASDLSAATNLVAGGEAKWSADGTEIVYVDPNGYIQLIVPRNGTKASPDNGQLAGASPSFVGDSDNEIVYEGGGGLSYALYTDNLTGVFGGYYAAPQQIPITLPTDPSTGEQYVGESNPTVSPDGTSVAFVSVVADVEQSNVFRVPITGGTAKQLTTYPPLVQNTDYYTFQLPAEPAWSPDGATIAYTLAVGQRCIDNFNGVFCSCYDYGLGEIPSQGQGQGTPTDLTHYTCGSTFSVALDPAWIPGAGSPTVSVADPEVVAPQSGSSPAKFTLTLSQASDVTVTVHYATADQSAHAAAGDYQSTSGTATFAPGQTSVTVDVPVKPVTHPSSSNLTFLLQLSDPVNATLGTAAAQAKILTRPAVSIADAAPVVRPKAGSRQATFAVTVSSWHQQPVNVSWKTVDGTAKSSAGDFNAGSGSFVLEPGESSHNITVDIPAKAKPTPPKLTFTVQISSPNTNVDVVGKTATGTILARSETVTLSFSPNPLTADGFSSSTGQVNVVDSDGNPVAGQQIRLSPPDGTPFPRVLICGPNGALYPTLSPTTRDVTGHDFFENTDGSGQIGFNVRVGTQSGNLLVNAAEPGAETASESDTERLQLNQGETVTPDGTQLAKQLRVINVQGSVQVGAGPSAFSGEITREAALQQVALDYLTTLKQSGNSALAGLDFAPVHSTDSMGHLDGGVLIYPSQGQQKNNAVSSAGVVWDVSNLTEHGTAIPTFFPTVAEWQGGGPGFIAHGPLVPGPVVPTPDDPVQYFGWPYPPPAQDIAARANYDATCVKSDPSAWGIDIHSPVSLLLRNRAGGEIGVASNGHVVEDAPGVLEFKHRKLVGIEIPPGSYTIALTGTGGGAAHLVFDLTNGSGDHTWTLAMSSRRGAVGSMTVGASGPGPARFGGHSYRATRGLGLEVSGLPARLKRGHAHRLSLRLTDAFGTAAPGMLVLVTGSHHFRVVALTNARGRVSFVIPKTLAGKLAFKFGGPAYRKLVRTVRLI